MGNRVLDGEQERGLRIDAVWDIETSDWDKFVAGSLWKENGGTSVYLDEDELARALMGLPQGFQVWAHAGGKFDVLWLLDWQRRHKCIKDARITMSGASIACCAFKGGPIFRDSSRIIPMSLAQASTMFPGRTVKQKLDLPCKCGKNCGGYCSISKDMPADQRKRMIEYLIADIESLRDTLSDLFEYAEKSKILLSGTLAGSTWRTASKWCGIPNAEWSSAEYKFIREGYKGGRCEGAKTVARKIWRYDRKQAYPAAMTKPLPTGFHRGLPSKDATRAYLNDKPGFYEVVIDIPEQHAPPLPVRRTNHITFPWGRVEGIYPRDEVQFAEECGATIVKIKRAVVWSTEEPILREYMEHCFALREAAETKALKTWVKLLANSLSGAFAQSPERDIIVLGDYADDPRYELVGRYDWVWKMGMYQIPDRGHIHYAGTLTGDARVELGREIRHAGDDWVYSDTDSTFAERELTRGVGSGLGEWDFQGMGHDWECLAPKVYAYNDDSGKRTAAAKGITKADKHWDLIRKREPVKMEGGVNSFLTAVRRPPDEGLFKKREMTRQMREPTEWLGARLRVGTGTKAPHVRDLVRLP